MSRIEMPGISSKVSELWEIVGEYEVVVEGLERTLKIKVKKNISSDTNHPFVGETNLQVKGTGCSDPYQSLAPQITKEAALHDAIQGFFTFYSDDADVIEVENW